MYQVDVTILRWLTLEPDEVLELECGEDIDVIRADIDAGLAYRTLDQIKNRPTSAISLADTDALSAIATFCEHRSLNSKIPLHFRFITTSRATKERNWQRETTGIQTWQALRNGEMQPSDADSALDYLRGFLSKQRKPKKLNIKTWKFFQNALSEPSEVFGSIIQAFEWSIGAPLPEAVERQIHELIQADETNLTAEEADFSYSRLFLHVFKLLAKPGQKLLKYEDRIAALSKKPTQSELRTLIDIRQLKEIASDVKGQIGAVERRLGQIEAQMGNALQVAAANVAMESFPGLDASTFHYAVSLSFDGPELIWPNLDRLDITGTLNRAIEESGFKVAVGEPGCGKTQACASVLSGKDAIWIQLRSTITEEKGSATIDACLSSLKRPAEPRLRDWYSAAVDQLKPGTVLVLDDLPRVVTGGVLAKRLEILSAVCRDRRHAILATSYYSLPFQVLNNCAAQGISVGRFSMDELAALLSLYGMPNELRNDKFLEFLSTVTGRLPVLVSAVARFFRDKNWKIAWQEAHSVMMGEFAHMHRKDSTSIIDVTLPDNETRDLLYRLTLTLGNFTEDTVDEIGKAPPGIRMVNEKFEKLVGVWVQPVGTKKFALSPLLDRQLANRLPKRTRLSIHARLAFGVLRRRKLDPFDVLVAFHHFTSATLFDQAALLLIRALMVINDSSPSEIEEFGVSRLWISEALPASVDLPLRIWLRALQIVSEHTKQHDITFLVDDFFALTSASTPDMRWGVLLGASYVAIRLAQKSPALTNRFIVEAVNAARNARLPDGTELPIAATTPLAEMMWATAISSRTPADAREWLKSLQQLTVEDRALATRSTMAADNSMVFCDNLWLWEYQKPEAERDWAAAESLLREVINVSMATGIQVLGTAAVRTLIVIEAECRQKLNEALEFARRELSIRKDDICRFMITEVMGRQLTYAERWEEGIEWIRQAIANPISDEQPLLKRNLLITLARGASQTNPEDAVMLTSQAVDVARSGGEKLQIADALSEKCIALWIAGRRRDSFLVAEEAETTYEASRKPDSLWGKSFRYFLHAAGYFGSMALGQRPPTQNYAPPLQGMFLGSSPTADDSVEDVHESLLYMRLAMFADGVGESERAAAWADRAMAVAPSSIVGLIIRMYGWLSTPNAILKHDYAGAVQRAWKASEQREFDTKVLQVEETAQPRPKDLSTEGRIDLSLMLTLVPTILQTLGEQEKRVELAESLANTLSTTDSTSFSEAISWLSSYAAGGSSWREWHTRAAQYWKNNKSALGFASLIASTLEAPLAQTIYTQVYLSQKLSQFFIFSRSAQEGLLEVAIRRFWENASTTRLQEFRTAQTYTLKALAEATEYKYPVRLKKILSAMVFCVGSRLTDELSTWLSQD